MLFRSFYKSEKHRTASGESDEVRLFNVLTKKNNLVYIDSGYDEATIIHATNALEAWGYWQITKNKEKADFILRFSGRTGAFFHWFGSAQFINPENNNIFKTTREVNAIWGWDFNSKRDAINKIVNKEIKPLFY